MKKTYLIGGGVAVVIIIAIIAWLLLDHRATQTDEMQAQAAANAQSLPTPTLATITAIHGNTLSLKYLNGSSTEAEVGQSTLLYSNGAPISSVALKTGEMVAVILYPQTSGSAISIAQTVTVVTH